MKTRPELFGQAAADGLSSDVLMAHLEALGWLYSHERDDCVIPAKLLRSVMVVTEDPDVAKKTLDAFGYWKVRADGSVEVLEHGDTVRQSLFATNKKRGKDRQRYERNRDEDRDHASTSGGGPDSESASGTGIGPDSESESALPTYLTTAVTGATTQNGTDGPADCRWCGEPSAFLDGGYCRRGPCIEDRKHDAKGRAHG